MKPGDLVSYRPGAGIDDTCRLIGYERPEKITRHGTTLISLRHFTPHRPLLILARKADVDEAWVLLLGDEAWGWTWRLDLLEVIDEAG